MGPLSEGMKQSISHTTEQCGPALTWTEEFWALAGAFPGVERMVVKLRKRTG